MVFSHWLLSQLHKILKKLTFESNLENATLCSRWCFLCRQLATDGRGGLRSARPISKTSFSYLPLPPYLYHIWLPSEMSTLSHSYLPNLHVLLLLPSFATLVSIMSIRVFHKWHFATKKRCNTNTHPSRVYINQIWKNFFPKTSLEGLATWSKKAKIDQNRRGGRMTVAWSFNSYQIVISSNTDCVSELWAEKKTCRQRRTTWWRARRRWPKTKKGSQSDF